MFTLVFEKTVEINIPLEKAWEYSLNLENWLKWTDQYEYASLEGTLKKGAVIEAKIKNLNLIYKLNIDEIDPLKNISVFIHTFTMFQKSGMSFESASEHKTFVKFSTSLRSIFVPFMRSQLVKMLEQQVDAYSKRFPPIFPQTH